MVEIDDKLEDWNALASAHKWHSLLVGNGASINIWPDFGYASLYSNAKPSLKPEQRAVFEELSTTNFETILEAAHHAEVVGRALGDRTEKISELSQQVKAALFGSVEKSHLPWGALDDLKCTAIAKILDSYDMVFTTNYDLCMYWAHMGASGGEQLNLIDFFWGDGNTFPSGTTLSDARGRTPILYLHGALHLWRDQWGQIGKFKYAPGKNLLDLDKNFSADSQREPLFISEGTYVAKFRSIWKSPYLRFCIETMAADQGNVVVFGHSLSKQDEHIASALTNGSRKRIAVSLRSDQESGLILKKKAYFLDLLEGHCVHFFDATSHPLGAPSLKVSKEHWHGAMAWAHKQQPGGTSA